ncbi:MULTISPECIES: hypothetical protein [unclassified Streptomyces]|nr:hypothetical protein [Streptomyces sp. NBC_01439]
MTPNLAPVGEGCSAAVTGEAYPGPGATIGPAAAFGRAARGAIAAGLG